MLNVFVNQDSVGNLFKSNFERGVFYFGYDGQCLSKNAVSLTMPVVTDPYSYNYKHQLHPIFDMNLPRVLLNKNTESSERSSSERSSSERRFSERRSSECRTSVISFILG